MMKVFFVCMVIFHMTIVLSERTQEATKLCVGTEEQTVMSMIFRLYRRQDQIQAVYIYDASTPQSSSSSRITNSDCFLTGTGADDDPFEFVVNVSISDPTQGQECGMFKLNPIVFRLRVKSVMFEGFDHALDAFYDIDCNFNDRLPTNLSPSVIIDPTETKVITLQPEKMRSVLEVRDKTNAPLTSAVLGDEVSLHLRFYAGYLSNRYDTYGTKFVIAIPKSHDTVTSVVVGLLIGNPSYVNANVTVSANSIVNSYTVFPGSMQSVTLNVQEISGNERTKTKTVVVISSEEIYILVVVKDSASSTRSWFTAHPVDTLGKNYTLINPSESLQVNSVVVVIATENDTNVSFSDTSSLLIPTNMNSLTEYEAFHVTTSSTSTTINNIRVTSNKPIAVITGTRGTSSNQVSNLEQLPDEEKFGKTFILIKERSECVALVRGGTVDKVSTVTQSVTNAFYRFTQSSGVPHGLSSSNPLLCAAVGTNAQFAVIPPVESWSNSYMFTNFYDRLYQITIAIEQGTENELLITVGEQEDAGNTITWSSVETPDSWNTSYVYGTYTTPFQIWPTVKLTHPTQTFLAIVESPDSKGMTAIAGFKLAHINPTEGCVPSSGYAGDLVDNDCDGLVDEDVGIDTGNNVLDLRQNIQGSLAVRVRPISCVAKSDTNWDNTDSQVTIVDGQGCLGGSPGAPLIPNSTFESLSADNVFPKDYSTGMFEVARFAGSPTLFFRCKLELCYSYNDSKCTTDICNNGSNRRRRSAQNNDVTIETSVNVIGNSLTSTSSSETESYGDFISSCYELHGYIGILCAMCFSLLITLLLPFVLFRRLMRNLDKEDDK